MVKEIWTEENDDSDYGAIVDDDDDGDNDDDDDWEVMRMQAALSQAVAILIGGPANESGPAYVIHCALFVFVNVYCIVLSKKLKKDLLFVFLK